MVQSVELLLDPDAEQAVLTEWQMLHAAGLPSEVRSTPSPSHRPHVTLLAVDDMAPDAEPRLVEAARGLDLDVRLGSPMCFTRSRRGQTSVILVRQVVATVALLELQQAVSGIAGPGLGEEFAAGRWTPHVTLARRMRPDQVGLALSLLAGQPTSAERDVRITRCRRWDSDAKRDWLF